MTRRGSWPRFGSTFAFTQSMIQILSLFQNRHPRYRVALVLTLVGFLLVGLNAAAVAEPPDVTDPFHGDPWRRTINGWEKTSDWNKTSDWEPAQEIDVLDRIARLHPFVLASFQLLVCVGTLVAFSDDEDWQIRTVRQGKTTPQG